MNSDLISLVLKNLSQRRLRSWLTMLGIFIGIAAIVALIGLGEGLRSMINAQFNVLGSDILRVNPASDTLGPPGTGIVSPLTDTNLNKIKSISGVEAAIGRIFQTGAKVEFNDRVGFGLIASMPEGKDRKVLTKLMNYEMESGRELRDGEKFTIVLGHNYVEDKNGFDKPVKVGSKVNIDGKDFEVVGVLKKKGSFTVDMLIIMNENAMKDIWGKKDYDFIGVQVREPSLMKSVKESIERYLRKARDVKIGEENFTVESPESILANLNSILLGVQIFVYVIAGISLLVGGIGITNSMYTSVLERTRDIGIMKSIGAKNSDIFTLFFLEAGLLGSIGGIIGVIFGIGIANFTAYIGKMALGSDLVSASISPWLIVGALLFSFLIGTLAGILPALNAAKQNPVDSLRYKK